MQTALDALHHWTIKNKVTVSIDSTSASKTCCCFYTKHRNEVNGKSIPHLTLGDIPVPHTTSPKYLGIIIDQQLRFHQQSIALAKKLSSRNNILKALSGRSWGQRSSSLRALYKTYTEAAANYAAGAWGTIAAPSNIKPIESCELSAARVILGCTKDSPALALLHEAKLTPFSIRALHLSSIEREKALRMDTTSPTYQTASKSIPLRVHHQGGRATSSFIHPPRDAGKSIAANSGLESLAREPLCNFAPIAPWEWHTLNITVYRHLEGCAGKEDSIPNIQAAFNDLISNLDPTSTLIYTDGSALDSHRNGGAAAIVIHPSRQSVNLIAPAGSLVSSYQAELTAINMGLEHMLDTPLPPTNFTTTDIWFLTDSQSSIITLEEGPVPSKNGTIFKIWNNIRYLSSHYHIIFQWIPGHRGIPGNVIADAAANRATNLDQSTVPLNFLIAKSHIKKHCSLLWKDMCTPANPYSTILTAPPPAEPPKYSSRSDEVTINQLRVGRSPLVRSCMVRYLSLPPDKALCPKGCNTAESIQHLLISCPYYSPERLRYLGPSPSISILVSKPLQVLEFLDSIQRLSPLTAETM